MSEWHLVVKTPTPSTEIWDVSDEKLDEPPLGDRVTAYVDRYNQQFPEANGEGALAWAHASVRGDIAAACLVDLACPTPEWWTVDGWSVGLAEGDLHPSVTNGATVHADLPELPPLEGAEA